MMRAPHAEVQNAPNARPLIVHGSVLHVRADEGYVTISRWQLIPALRTFGHAALTVDGTRRLKARAIIERHAVLVDRGHCPVCNAT